MARTTVIAATAIIMAGNAAAGDVFIDHVAGILERHCVFCHRGSDPAGGLALTAENAVLDGGDSGPAVVPGNPDDSLIIEQIIGSRPRMPKNADPLSPEQVDQIRQWITDGAKWPKGMILRPRWWSLEPVRMPAVPDVCSGWNRTPVDAFILAKLQTKGLTAASEADRRTLIRRLTFDLHGLPPTPDEIDEFLADSSADAYERLVDRLLASPRYGERWARHWLDLVHYGESHGYDKDKPRPNAWPYRDYVISALNTDKEYDRFVCEQLAGDVLNPDDPAGIVATGFIAAGPWDFVGHVELREGSLDKEVTRSNDRDDMVTTAMSTFLSLTVHCGRCHDHKFDPITQHDYYRLQAVFAGVERADRPYHPDPQVHKQRRRLTAQRHELERRRTELEQRIRALVGAELIRLDEQIRTLERESATLLGREASPTNGYHSAISATPGATKWVQVDLGAPVPIDAIRLIPARPTDFPDTPGFGFPLRFRVEIGNDESLADAQLVFDHSGADFPNPSDSPMIIPGKRRTGRFVRVTATRLWERTDDFAFAMAELQVESGGRNLALGARVTALDSIEAGRWGVKNLVDGHSSRRRLEVTADSQSKATAIQQKLDNLARRRNSLIEQRVDPSVRTTWNELSRECSQLDRQIRELPAASMVYAATNDFAPQGSFTPSKGPRAIHLLRRGDVQSPGPLVNPGALACISGLPHEFALTDPNHEGERRAALAAWIVDPANPLTYRSIVNRVWQHHFGRGIVDTANDFGRMGSLPTHPELLDWLSIELRRGGASLKRLHRMIVCSAVYRQSSRYAPQGGGIDADNRYLWRMNRRRLDAEALRDAALAVGGRLDTSMGGPSVRWFGFEDDHSPRYQYDAFDVDSPAGRRRSIYRFIVRSVPDPFMECLDCPDPSLWMPKRTVTLTAIQALAAWNNRFMVRQAEHFAARVARETSDPSAQARRAYLLAMGRPPDERDWPMLLEFSAEHGLANVCRVLFNSNEFMFID